MFILVPVSKDVQGECGLFSCQQATGVVHGMERDILIMSILTKFEKSFDQNISTNIHNQHGCCSCSCRSWYPHWSPCSSSSLCCCWPCWNLSIQLHKRSTEMNVLHLEVTFLFFPMVEPRLLPTLTMELELFRMSYMREFLSMDLLLSRLQVSLTQLPMLLLTQLLLFI